MSAVESVESVRVELDREKQALLEAQGETASAEAELAYQEEQVRHLKIDVANAKASSLFVPHTRESGDNMFMRSKRWATQLANLLNLCWPHAAH